MNNKDKISEELVGLAYELLAPNVPFKLCPYCDCPQNIGEAPACPSCQAFCCKCNVPIRPETVWCSACAKEISDEIRARPRVFFDWVTDGKVGDDSGSLRADKEYVEINYPKVAAYRFRR